MFKLSEEELRQELLRRGQDTEGPIPMLYDRLLRLELEAPFEFAHASPAEVASEFLSS
jgi:hypothetical protein